MKYLTPNDLKKIEHKKGTILVQSDRINLVERDATELGQGLKVYTVWNFEENFVFVQTTDLLEAQKTFEKYTKLS
jgi:hypothetical protein